MPIEKLDEFAKNGQKSTEGIILENGFPQEEKPARQWFNYILNSQAVKSNELIDEFNIIQQDTLDIQDSLELVRFDTGITSTAKYTGSVERTQSDKNSDSVSIKSWGVTPSETIDQTTKIQTALNNTPLGKPLKFPKGIYLISQKLTISRPINVFFEDSTILVAEGFSEKSAVLITSSNVTLSGLNIEGANLPVPAVIEDIKGFGIDIVGTQGNILENVVVRGGLIKDTPFSALHAEYTKNLSVIDLESFNCSTAITSFTLGTLVVADSYAPKVIRYKANSPVNKGVYFDTCVGGVIAFCNVYDAYLSSAYYSKNSRNCVIIGNYGENIRNNTIDSSEGGGLKLSRGNQDMIVSQNQFVNCAVVIQGSQRVLFTDNTFNQQESDALHIMSHGTYQKDVSDIVVSRNIFNMNASASLPASTMAAITLNSSEGFSCKNIKIKDNLIVNANVGVFTKTEIFGSSQYDGISILNNTISNTVKSCIDLGSFKNVTVSGNNLSGSGSSSTTSGIVCSSYSSNDTDAGNMVIRENNLTNFGTGNGIQARYFSSYKLDISNNFIDGCGISVYVNAYAEKMFVDNNYCKNSTTTANFQLISSKPSLKTHVTVTNNKSNNKILMDGFGTLSIGSYLNNDMVVDSRSGTIPSFYTTLVSPDKSVWKVSIDNAGVLATVKI